MGLNLFSESEELAALVANLIRVGEVTSVDAVAVTARVRFEDRDNVESFDLQVMQRRSHAKKTYSLPDVGEPVICLFLPSGVEQGFVLGSYYPATATPPAASVDVEVLLEEPGTRIEYSRATKTATLVTGATAITASPAELRLESNGSALVLNAAGASLSGAQVRLNS